MKYPLKGGGGMKNVHFVPIARMEDSQAIRTAAFHPSGRFGPFSRIQN